MENNGEYSNRDILNLFYIHGECNRITERTCRRFNETYPHLPIMNKAKFKRMEENFIQFGSIRKVKRIRQKQVVDVENNEVNVLANFEHNPHGSIRSCAKDSGLSYYGVQAILKKHKMHPFSLEFVQQLLPGDNLRRINFCEGMLVKIQEDRNFLKRIIWTDEAKFDREGIVNRRNWHYWAAENPHFKRSISSQYKFSFNVFCLVMDNQVKFQIYNEPLTSLKYLEILRTTVSDFLDDLPLNVRQNAWYQLDGAPAHSTNEVYHELTETFQDRWYGRNGPWLWPARSPDLTPLDFFVWGTIKNQVYRNAIETKEELLNKVRNAFQLLPEYQIQKACTTEINNRLLNCLRQNGGHFE